MIKLISLLFFIGFYSIAFSQTVTIGKKVWMSKNLSVVKFRNGDPIPHAKTNAEWENAGKNKQPAWCYYNNDPANGEKYGLLYNWYAVNDRRGLSPAGWHVPSETEWEALCDYLGGESDAGEKMKNSSGWKENGNGNGNGTNSSGFAGLPGGNRFVGGNFKFLSEFGMFWSTTVDSDFLDEAIACKLYYLSGKAYVTLSEKEEGLSVRCIRNTDATTPNELPAHKGVAIGNQVWMNKNLTVVKFRNGDRITKVTSKQEWVKAAEDKEPAWCFYDFNDQNGEKYGKIYNWYAVSDPRGLAPAGWHIPTEAEWETLCKHLGRWESGEKLKTTSGWKGSGNGTNSSGFAGLPGGILYPKGDFKFLGEQSYWWGSGEIGKDFNVNFYLSYESYMGVVSTWALRGDGMYVRCLRD